MAYKTLDIQVTLKGALLAITHALFPEEIPSLRTYGAQTGVAPSTFSRAGQWLLKLLPGIFRRRRPGPGEAAPQSIASMLD